MQREITVFTPKMDAVSLPEGSTAIDFAFYLNPSLAKKMSDVKINGVKNSINTILTNLDIVEIKIGKEDLVCEDWLNHAQTSKALKEITDLL